LDAGGLLLVGEPGTGFFTGALLSNDTTSFEFDLGDACEMTIPTETDFPIAVLPLLEPVVGQAVYYACLNNQVAGRVTVDRQQRTEAPETLAPTASTTLATTLAPVRGIGPGIFGGN
jgi:hypothetical protein